MALVTAVTGVVDKKAHLAGALLSRAFTTEVVDGTQLMGAVQNVSTPFCCLSVASWGTYYHY
jgi:hypothetical protein